MEQPPHKPGSDEEEHFAGEITQPKEKIAVEKPPIKESKEERLAKLHEKWRKRLLAAAVASFSLATLEFYTYVSIENSTSKPLLFGALSLAAGAFDLELWLKKYRQNSNK